MAQRRMFSPDIVDSDAFLDMPQSSQLLYFHLAMRADDDGFVNPKKIIRMIGSNQDDLKVLLLKRFILAFESGVVVIKHWLIHNLIRSDRYKETLYLDEKNSLKIKENRAYTELTTNGCQNDNQMEPQVRLGKVRLGKVRLDTAETSSASFSFNEKLSLMEKDKDKRMNIIAFYWTYKKMRFENQLQYSAAIKRELRPSQNLIGYPIERVKEVMFWLNGEDWIDWTLETVHKYIDKDLNNIKSKI